MIRLKRSDINPMPHYFDRYIMQVDDVGLGMAFEKSLQELEQLDIPAFQAVGTRVYEPGKWTIADIIQHITDTERVFAYRALRFGRNDATLLPGFDQDLFADNAHAIQNNIIDLINELKIVRRSSQMLFSHFDEADLQRKGICYNSEISVLAIGFNIIGHQNHHMKIIEERYIPLGKSNDKK